MTLKALDGRTRANGRCNAAEWVGSMVALHLMGDQAVLWDAVSVCSGYSVVLVKAPHAVQLIVDAAGDVLDVLHVGPDG